MNYDVVAIIVDSGLGFLVALIGGVLRWLHSIDQKQEERLKELEKSCREQALHAEERYARRDDVQKDFEKIDAKLERLLDKVDALAASGNARDARNKT